MDSRTPWARLKNLVQERLDRRYVQVDRFDELSDEVSALRDGFGADPSVPGLVAPPDGYDSAIRLDIFRELLEPMQPGRLLDLGAGHGAFALVASELGWEVTAVDARKDRFPEISGIDWIEADLRTFEIVGFDVICLLGILYHLGLEDQLDLLRRCSGTPTILDTHTTQRADITIEGYDGWLFEEERTVVTASWGNEHSFWPTHTSLEAMLSDCGYRFVFRLAPEYYPNRTFYLCL